MAGVLVFNNELLSAVLAALIALAVPFNTALLIVLRRKQREGNHYADVIRQLAAAIAKEKSVDPQAQPHEVAGAVEDAVRDTEGVPR